MSGSTNRLEITHCRTNEELAAALAKHWDAGLQSLTTGKVSAWLEQNGGPDELVKFVQQLVRAPGASEEVRLLQLILRLSPTHEPVWRGNSLFVAGLHGQAVRAEGGDRHAQQWLVSVFVQRALRVLPPVLYPNEAALAEHWEIEYDNCMTLWHAVTTARTDLRKAQTSIAGVTNFDAMVYGEPAGLRDPAPAKLLPILLLSLTDTTYGERLRERTRQAAMAWLADNRWLERLLNGTDRSGWVIAGFLLPYARDASADEDRKRRSTKTLPKSQHADLTQLANEALVQLRKACTGLSPLATGVERKAMAVAGNTLLSLLAEARARGVPAEEPLMRCLRTTEPTVRRIVKRLDNWTEVQQGNLFSRMWGIVELRNAIRKLGRALPARVPAP